VGVKFLCIFNNTKLYIFFLGEIKNGGCDEAIKNCTFGEHPAILANNNLLAKPAIGE
jgi:hypothetical protein